MFFVESLIRDGALTRTMADMRTWLDHQRSEPSTFRYTFTARGVVCRVDFRDKRAAADFARAFEGRLVELKTETAL